MTVPRFFIPPKAIDPINRCVVHTDVALIKQLTKVLRLAPGAKIDFLDGAGALYHCRLVGCDKNTVEAEIEEKIENENGQTLRVNVALAPLKNDRFEWALEKLTELGVYEIAPILVERSVVKPSHNASRTQKGFELPEEASGKLHRWLSIVKEAAEQSERTLLPHLVPPLSFSAYLRSEENRRPNSLRFICAERSTGHTLRQSLCNQARDRAIPIEDITIAVGAEGGFTEHELHSATEAGFIPVSLGKQILRAETAAIYALAIVASQLTAEP